MQPLPNEATARYSALCEYLTALRNVRLHIRDLGITTMGKVAARTSTRLLNSYWYFGKCGSCIVS